MSKQRGICDGAKKLFGKEEVLEMGWDLTEANLKFGDGWLDE